MEWLIELFCSHSALQAVVIMSLIIAIGRVLGKLQVFGISLGVTFVFFTGILAGHLGFSVDAQMLTYAESMGLVLFVYALGLQVGPGFISSFTTSRSVGTPTPISLAIFSSPASSTFCESRAISPAATSASV